MVVGKGDTKKWFMRESRIRQAQNRKANDGDDGDDDGGDDDDDDDDEWDEGDQCSKPARPSQHGGSSCKPSRRFPPEVIILIIISSLLDAIIA